MKIGVTGAAGFVGTNLVNRLLEDGHHIVAIDREPGNHVAKSDNLTWVKGNVLDENSMRTALDGTDLVFHLVAMITLRQQDPLAWRVNTEGVRTVARAALAVGTTRFVHLSSVHSFDQHHCGELLSEISPRSEDLAIPVYDRSKWAGEQELRKVIEDGLDATICNPTGIWGPADHLPRLSRINGLARDAARGRIPAFISGAGYDLVDVRDVVEGAILAAEKGRTGENYLLGGEKHDLIHLLRTTARYAGRRGPLLGIPLRALETIMPVAEPIGTKLGSDVISKAALSAVQANPTVDHTKAQRELGYDPRPMAETAKDFVKHLVHTRQLGR